MANVNRNQGRITDKEDKQEAEQEMIKKGATIVDSKGEAVSSKDMAVEKEEVMVGKEEMAEVKKRSEAMQ
jgi:hypothetical protein